MDDCNGLCCPPCRYLGNTCDERLCRWFPQALVARDQLEYAVAELATYQNQRITTIFNDALEAAITGTKTPADALKEAQAQAEAILKDYR